MSNSSDQKTAIKTMKLYHQVERVFNELLNMGIGPEDPLDVGTLSELDQYHYLGTDAVDEAIRCLRIDSDMRVIEIGGGIGGPARYLGHATGCRVTALELQPDLNKTATILTERAGLSDHVDHLCGDILNGVPGSLQYDALVSWLTFLHIPDRKSLYRQCINALKPGAWMYAEDYFERGTLSDKEKQALSKQVFCDFVPSMSDYHSDLEEAGFTQIRLEDVTVPWTQFVAERQTAFEQNRARNLDVHGSELVEGLGEFYATIVDLFQGGNLGGIKVMAKRSA